MSRKKLKNTVFVGFMGNGSVGIIISTKS